MRRGAQAVLLGGSLAIAWPSLAQTVTTSPGPDSVAVTVYRDPDRPAARAMELSWLNGFALISETRRVEIPAGEGEIRFEGVAGGILPESAIVSGLPGGVTEKNQDAFLLSPASLLDASLGRRVHLRRTSRATGQVRENEALVRSGAAGAVVIETQDGIEALRCSGLNEKLVYDSIPAGLSAKPTLSVRFRSAAAARATVTLSYLAAGFDWQANYIASLNPAGDRMDLLAWVTLANGDETSFVRADTQAVAGRLNRERANRAHRYTPPLNLRCWAAGTTTSDLSDYGESSGEEIVVTGSRIDRMDAPPPPPPVMMEAVSAVTVVQEELGDLKLYRIPEPVTVAAKSQKQVAMLQRRAVKVRQIFRSQVSSGTGQYVLSTVRVLITRNRAAEGLGLPLPAGGSACSARDASGRSFSALARWAIGPWARMSRSSSAGPMGWSLASSTWPSPTRRGTPPCSPSAMR